MIIKGEKVLDLSDVRLPGKHNLQNIIIAASACKQVGVSNTDIQEVIRNFTGVEHRIEFVRELNGVKYYNDSKATNTDATITALKSFDKGVILLVGGFEKGLAMDDVKKYLGCVKQVIGYGLSGRRIATDLVGDKAVIVEDLVQAVHEANKYAQAGDIVLLSPTTSSFDQYSGFEERGRHFKEIVNAL
jgi:UDP-N-acetylmuramoylalanine--D-glutamate ligase